MSVTVYQFFNVAYGIPHCGVWSFSPVSEAGTFFPGELNQLLADVTSDLCLVYSDDNRDWPAEQKLIKFSTNVQ